MATSSPCLPSPTQDCNCWLWEGMGVASARGAGLPTPRSQPSVMNNTQVHSQQKRVHARFSLRIATVSFCLKSKGIGLEMNRAGRQAQGNSQTLLSQLLSSGKHSHLHEPPPGGGTPSPASSSKRVVSRTCLPPRRARTWPGWGLPRRLCLTTHPGLF